MEAKLPAGGFTSRKLIFRVKLPHIGHVFRVKSGSKVLERSRSRINIASSV